MLTEHQQEAYDIILESLNDRRHIVLSGYAGTGKSYLTNAIVRELHKQKKSYIILAPIHKALSILRENELESNKNFPESPLNSKFETVASNLRIRPNFDNVGMDLENPDFIFSDEKLTTKVKKHYDYIIIDECSMISSIIFKELMRKVNVTYLFIGDIAQLPPIGEVSSKTFDMKNIIFLTEIVRTKDTSIIDLCNLARSDNYMDIKNYKTNGNVIVMSKNNYKYDCEKILAFTNNCVSKHNNLAKRNINPSKSIVCKGDVIMFYNDVFTSLKPRPTWLPKYSAKNFYPGEKLVSNCEEFIVDSIEDNDKTCKIKLINSNNQTPLEFLMIKPPVYKEFIRKYVQYKEDWDLNKLFNLKYNCILPEPVEIAYKNPFGEVLNIQVKKTFDLAYSLTVHKSQGSTYDSVAVDVKDILFSKSDAKTLLYTAISRAKNKVILLV